MGWVVHGCATTREAVRRAIHARRASVRWLARHSGIGATTAHTAAQTWRKRATPANAPIGPKRAYSTVLTSAEEAVVAFRRHTLLPLDGCLYALQPTIPHLRRSTLHRCLPRHGIARLPDAGAAPTRGRFRAYPIGYVHADVAKVHTEAGRLHLLVAVDRHLQVRLRRAVRARPAPRRRRLPRGAGRGGAVPRAHGAARPRHAVRRHLAHRRVAGGARGVAGRVPARRA